MKICKWYDSQCCMKPDFPMLICALILDKIKPDWEKIDESDYKGS